MRKGRSATPSLRALATASVSQSDTQASFAKALDLHKRGHLGEAEQLYRTILRIAPRHFEATHFLGVILLQRGRVEEGERSMRQAIEINPHVAKVHINR